MKKRQFIKYLLSIVPIILSPRLFAMLNINLSSSGRVGFYIDYSELATTGTHTFYVTRTHGTAGAVSVDFESFGDAHTKVSGAITFANGEAGVKSLMVDVPAKTVDGDHRIHVQLSNPTNGLILQNGVKTIAYGVIDDGTIAIDASAVFFDTAAGTGTGTGTQADPYGSIYTAIANVGSKRYIYGKGTVIPDGTNTTTRNGGGGTPKCIDVPAGRAGESTRLYIQAWPGFSFIVDGTGSTDIVGFDGQVTGKNYLTYRNIDFTNLNCSGATYCEGGGIAYLDGNHIGINVEYCTGDNINGSTNTALFNPYSVDGSKMWKCTANNIQVNGDNTNQNASGLLEYYEATNLSIQRCEVTNSGVGLHFKRPLVGHVCPTVRFCIIKSLKGVKFGFGGADHASNYACIQSNLFKDCTQEGGIHVTGSSPDADGNNVISNNVFDNCGSGDDGAIRINDAYLFKIYNNIMLKSRKVWDVPELETNQTDQTRNVISYADYNHEFETTFVLYEYLSYTYTSSASLNASDDRLAGNDSTGDPLFNEPTNDDYTLQSGSPCIANGVDGSNQGIYLTGIEKLGTGIKRAKPLSDVTVT